MGKAALTIEECRQHHGPGGQSKVAVQGRTSRPRLAGLTLGGRLASGVVKSNGTLELTASGNTTVKGLDGQYQLSGREPRTARAAERSGSK